MKQPPPKKPAVPGSDVQYTQVLHTMATERQQMRYLRMHQRVDGISAGERLQVSREWRVVEALLAVASDSKDISSSGSYSMSNSSSSSSISDREEDVNLALLMFIKIQEDRRPRLIERRLYYERASLTIDSLTESQAWTKHTECSQGAHNQAYYLL